MHRFFVASVLALCVCFGAFVNAQETAGFDADAFDTLAERAASVVDRGEASTDAFEALRLQLSEFRSSALAAQEARGREVALVREQIDALGPAPAEGETEAAEVAAQREALTQKLAESSAPVQVANAAYERADGLIRSIDRLIRQRQAARLLSRDASPLWPANWPEAITGLTKYFGTLGAEISSAWNNEAEAVERLRNAPAIILFVVLGLLMLMPVSSFLLRRLQHDYKEDRTSLYDLRQIVLSFLLLSIPFFGFYLILQAVDLANILGLRGEMIRNAYFPIAASVLGAYWLANTFFARNGPNLQPITFDQGRLGRGKSAVRLMGWVLAALFLLSAFRESANWPSSTYSVLAFPFIIIGALAIWFLTRQLRRFRASKKTDEDEETPLMNRLVRFLTVFCYGVAFVAPIVGALGYTNAATTLISSTILSMGMGGALVVIYTFMVTVLDLVEAPHRERAKARGEEAGGSIWRVLLGGLTIFSSLPLLALIWGARNSDLQDVWRYLKEGVTLGETRISATDFLTFVLIFFIGYTITRMLQSALRTNVLPNTKINKGAQNALVTGLGYIGIFLAALFAILAMGLDLSNIAIVAGALSVGIGFGLQAIVSNFVSGIILLIERPIEIGDWVEVGSYSGYVRDISVRSTSIETFDRATVIVPNADLIAGTVTNFTHGNNYGRVKVPVGVAYGSDTRQVEEILLEIAKGHSMVLGHPAPNVMFMGFGASSMDFEIRAILRDVNWVMSVRSDMNHEIAKRFAEAGIEIPFAQREITLKNPEVLAPVVEKSAKK